MAHERINVRTRKMTSRVRDKVVPRRANIILKGDEKVKFLTIGTWRDVFYNLPKAEQAKILSAECEYLMAYKKKSADRWHYYSDPQQSQGITIGEYKDLEEFSQYLQSPALGACYANKQVIPLVEWDVERYQVFMKQLRAMK